MAEQQPPATTKAEIKTEINLEAAEEGNLKSVYSNDGKKIEAKGSGVKGMMEDKTSWWWQFKPGNYADYESLSHQLRALFRSKSKQERLAYFGYTLDPPMEEEKGDRKPLKARFFQPHLLAEKAKPSQK